MVLAVKHWQRQGLPENHVRWEDVQQQNVEIDVTLRNLNK
jgi:predicted RNA polymerase sigma factor